MVGMDGDVDKVFKSLADPGGGCCWTDYARTTDRRWDNFASIWT